METEWQERQFNNLTTGDLTEYLERRNFLSWYRGATPEDMEIARRNNAKKLESLMKKYASDITYLEIQYGRKRKSCEE